MKADIESKILFLDRVKMYSNDIETFEQIERKIRFLKMILDAPCNQITKKVLNFVY